MSPFVSVWKMLKSKKAFTIIETMVAVMIISIVVIAIIEMNGNISHIFSKFNSHLKINQFASIFISNKNYGFEKKSVNLDDLLSDFKIENDLRRELKNIKIDISYKELDTFDIGKSEYEEANSNLIFKIGKTVLQTNNSSAALIRFGIQQ